MEFAKWVRRNVQSFMYGLGEKSQSFCEARNRGGADGCNARPTETV